MAAWAIPAGGGTHEHLSLRIFAADGVGDGLFDGVAHGGRGENQAIVAVDGAFDALAR